MELKGTLEDRRLAAMAVMDHKIDEKMSTTLAKIVIKALEDKEDGGCRYKVVSLSSSLSDSTVVINGMEFCALPCLTAEMDDASSSF